MHVPQILLGAMFAWLMSNCEDRKKEIVFFSFPNHFCYKQVILCGFT